MKLTRPPAPAKRGPGPLSTRNGTLAVAGILALLAGAALLLFLRQYRDDLTGSDPVRVLVARSLVPKGTPGDVVAGEHLYKVVRLRNSQLKPGAITDPEGIVDKVAATDVYPGHQLQAEDFEPSAGKAQNRLSGFQRAMAVPVDAAHGMIGRIDAGDRVDVIVTYENGVGGLTVARIAARNALVLNIPSEPKDGGVRSVTQPVTIRVGDESATEIAGAADGGKVWLVLRPAVGARSHESTEAIANALRKGGVKADINIDLKGQP